MALKSIHTAGAVVVIAAASGAAWWYQQKPQGPREPGARRAWPRRRLRRFGRLGGGGAARPGGGGGAGRDPAHHRRRAGRGQPALAPERHPGPEVSGRVTQINFRDAERVRKGQLMVQLDDQLPLAQVKQAEAELSIARANHRRNQELVELKFIAQRAVDESAATCRWPSQAGAGPGHACPAEDPRAFDGIAGIRNSAWATTSRTAPTSSTSRTSMRCTSTSGCPSASRPRCAAASWRPWTSTRCRGGATRR